MTAEPVQNNETATGGVTGKGFKPGRSGNPGGRAKGLARRIRDIAPPDKLADFYLAVFDSDLETLGPGFKVTLADRMKAGDWLAERGYGKAVGFQPIDDDPLDMQGEEIRAAADRFTAQVVRLADRRPATETAGTNGEGGKRNGRPAQS
ncbi:MAG: hypothetical protein NUW01_12995 [Gemmatimonadaceae bacterium]|nr:hypothetical protein [Gemmatimonadaceae bacterium]